MPVDYAATQQRLSFKSIARSQQTRTADTCPTIHPALARSVCVVTRPRATHSIDMVNNSCNCVQITELAGVHLNAFPSDVFLSIKARRMNRREVVEKESKCPIKALNDNNVL